MEETVLYVLEKNQHKVSIAAEFNVLEYVVHNT